MDLVLGRFDKLSTDNFSVALFLLDNRLRVETLLDFEPSKEDFDDFLEFSDLRLLVDILLDVAFG